MKVIITEDILIGGQHTPAGTELEMDEGQARQLILIKRAKAPQDDPEGTAEVLAKAKLELLEQIAQAPSLEQLEMLLSEDPEIVAAYETRLAELEKEQ